MGDLYPICLEATLPSEAASPLATVPNSQQDPDWDDFPEIENQNEMDEEEPLTLGYILWVPAEEPRENLLVLINLCSHLPTQALYMGYSSKRPCRPIGGARVGRQQGEGLKRAIATLLRTHCQLEIHQSDHSLFFFAETRADETEQGAETEPARDDQDIFFKVQQMFKRKQMGRPIAYNRALLHTLEKGLGVQRSRDVVHLVQGCLMDPEGKAIFPQVLEHFLRATHVEVASQDHLEERGGAGKRRPSPTALSG